MISPLPQDSFGAATATRTTYRQALSLASTFAIQFGNRDPLSVSIDRAAITDGSDAAARLVAAGLAVESTDGEIAESLIDPVEYDLRKDDLLILQTYDANKIVDLEYADSVLDLGLHVNASVAGDYDIAFDLENLPGIGEFLTSNGVVELDLETSGQVHVDGGMDLDLNFTIDLSQLGNPSVLIRDDSQVTFDHLVIETLTPIDATGSLTIDGIKVLELAIRGATADVDLSGKVSLVDDPEDNRHTITELADNSGLWNVDLVGNVDVDLPLYFPTASTPIGGSEADDNGDGFGDNVLHVEGDFRGTNDFDLEFVVPDLFSYGDLFNLLKDPKNLLTGLSGFFGGIQELADQLATVNIPLIGSGAFKDLGDSLEQLEELVMGDKSEADFIYLVDGSVAYTNDVTYSGKLGGLLQNRIEAGVEDVFAEIVDQLRISLWDGLKDVDSDLFSFLVPVMDADGNVQFDSAGNVRTERPDSADDIQLIITDDGTLTFNLMFGGLLVGELVGEDRVLADDVWLPDGTLLAAGTTVHQGDRLPQPIPIDFNAGIPGLNFDVDANLNTQIDYLMGLGLGLGGSGVFLDTSGINNDGQEIALNISAGLTPGSTREGTLGFLKVSLDEIADEDGGSGIFGSLAVDLSDSGNDGRWTIGESLDMSLSASAFADVDLAARVPRFRPCRSLAVRACSSPRCRRCSIMTRCWQTSNSGSGGSSTQFGATPNVVFEDVTIELGEFIAGFVGPLIDEVSEGHRTGQTDRRIADHGHSTAEVDSVPRSHRCWTSPKSCWAPTKFVPVATGLRRDRRDDHVCRCGQGV